VKSEGKNGAVPVAGRAEKSVQSANINISSTLCNALTERQYQYL